MRKEVSDSTINTVTELIKNELYQRINEKGRLQFISTHECYGILKEEEHELLEALQSNDVDMFINEMVDIAVASIFSVASIITDQESI